MMEDIEGVSDFYVHLKSDRVVLIYDERLVDLDHIQQQLKEMGFQIGNVQEVDS